MGSLGHSGRRWRGGKLRSDLLDECVKLIRQLWILPQPSLQLSAQFDLCVPSGIITRDGLDEVGAFPLEGRDGQRLRG